MLHVAGKITSGIEEEDRRHQERGGESLVSLRCLFGRQPERRHLIGDHILFTVTTFLDSCSSTSGTIIAVLFF